MKITLTVNDKLKTLNIPINRSLLEQLKILGFWSVKLGCEDGECGNCCVIVDGLAVNSCRMLAVQADGTEIETYESLNPSGDITPLQDVLMDFGDTECGFCMPGMLLSIKALLDKNPEATEEEVVDALAGHVCHCTRTVKPKAALLKVVRKLQKQRRS